MPRNSKRKLAVSVLLAALFNSCPPLASASLSLRGSASQPLQAAVNQKTGRGRALWPGSRFTKEERARAVRRGLRFIYRTALDRENFEAYGSEYLWCFYTISEGVSEAGGRRLARRMGLERARVWRRS